MNDTINKIKRVFRKIRACFPSPVPQGVSEFQAWSSDIIELYGFPQNDSVVFALATMVLHSGPSDAYLSKRSFALKVKAGAAKQVASQVFQDIKLKQQKAAEVTATSTQAPSDAPQK